MRNISEQGVCQRLGRTLAVLAAAFLWLTGAGAAELPTALTLNGFYTLDATLAKGANVYYPSRDNDTVSILLRDGQPSYDFSLLGVQAELALGDNLRFTTQAVAGRQTRRHSLSPLIEWSYLTYDFGDDLYLRGGKFKTPLLQGTELRHVGYSRLWARPLIPSSGAGGFDDYKGLELIKSARLGDYSLRVQGGWGVADHVLPEIDNRRITVLGTRFGRDESWVNLGLLHARYDINAKSGPPRRVVADSALSMLSLETELWFDRAVVNAGHARGNAEVSPDETMNYLSLGYRLDRVTPYALYHERVMRFGGAVAGPPAGAPMPPGAPPPPPPKSGTQSLRSFALGLRYDLGATHALKVQLERQRGSDDTDRLLGLQRYSATLLSITLEGSF